MLLFILSEECDFRITNEGMASIAPFLNARVHTITADEFAPLLKNTNTSFDKLGDSSAAFCRGVKEGCVIFKVVGGCDDEEVCMAPVWRGRGSINILIGKVEKAAIYMRICGEVLVFEEKKEFKNVVEVVADATEKGEVLVEEINVVVE